MLALPVYPGTTARGRGFADRDFPVADMVTPPVPIWLPTTSAAACFASSIPTSAIDR